MLKNAIETAYTERRPLLEALRDVLSEGTRDALSDVEHIDRVAYRVKDQASFVKKACNSKYADPLIELEDQVAGRVITFFRDDIKIVRARLMERFGAVEDVVKEPERPSEFDYESVHFVFVIPEHLKPSGWGDIAKMPRTFELQLRTLFMHAWAEPQHDLGYKAADGAGLDLETKRELAWIAASAWGADKMLNDVAARLNSRS